MTKQELLEWSLLMETNRDSKCADISNKSISELKYEMKKRQQDLLDKDSIFGDLITNDAQAGNFIF